MATISWHVELNPGAPLDMPAELKNFERAIIVVALELTQNKKGKAADLLKINRTTLVEKMRRLEIPLNERVGHKCL